MAHLGGTVIDHPAGNGIREARWEDERLREGDLFH